MRWLVFALALSTCAHAVPAQEPPNMSAKPYVFQELIPVVKDGIPAIVYFNGDTYVPGNYFTTRVVVQDVGVVVVQLYKTVNADCEGGCADTATVLEVPEGFRAEPSVVAVPEGGREVIYLLPDGLS
jgi:hypothetical protein